jgi:GT2 family glycosyltransferase/tetratricopeptide (TPR) repeat protein
VIGRAAKPADREAQIRDADRLRDARQHVAAAKAYAAVLALAPQRTDIRVQYANMLKDSGRPAEAEAAYRQALGEAPDDSDIHLQLGHALKLQGKRNEAIAEYRRAAGLRPDNTEALKELFFAGSFDDQHQLFERRLATGGVEAIMALGEEIARLQDALQHLAEKLPDLQAEAAVPLAGYDRFRRLYDVPPAPAPLLRQVVDFDTLLETNPFGETIAVERAAYAGLARQLVTGSIAAARASLLLNLAGDGRVGHIPLPLVACDAKTAAAESPPGAHQAAVWAYLMAAGESRPVIVEPPDSAAASLAIRWRPRDEAEPLLVIIPTRDNGGDLGNFVASLRERAERPDALRLLVVDNGSRDPETLRILEGVAAEPGARVVPLDEPFNWSRLNNRAVELSDETLLVFANDDMLMLSPGWDRQLRGLLSRPEVGAVGARLLYPDDTVQHAGILFDWQGLAIHDGLYEQQAEAGPCGRWHVTRAVSAVDGAFIGIRREVFAAHGGFDAIGLPIAHSDIDLALKLRASGLKILWTPHVTLRHFESKSRGLDHLDPEKAARNRAERRLLAERWGIALTTEPSLNPLWHQATLPFRLLAMPSEARLWRHIRLCASANPWLPCRGDEPAAPDQPGSSR